MRKNTVCWVGCRIKAYAFKFQRMTRDDLFWNQNVLEWIEADTHNVTVSSSRQEYVDRLVADILHGHEFERTDQLLC